MNNKYLVTEALRFCHTAVESMALFHLLSITLQICVDVCAGISITALNADSWLVLGLVLERGQAWPGNMMFFQAKINHVWNTERHSAYAVSSSEAGRSPILIQEAVSPDIFFEPQNPTTQSTGARGQRIKNRGVKFPNVSVHVLQSCIFSVNLSQIPNSAQNTLDLCVHDCHTSWGYFSSWKWTHPHKLQVTSLGGQLHMAMTIAWHFSLCILKEMHTI